MPGPQNEIINGTAETTAKKVVLAGAAIVGIGYFIYREYWIPKTSNDDKTSKKENSKADASSAIASEGGSVEALQAGRDIYKTEQNIIFNDVESLKKEIFNMNTLIKQLNDAYEQSQIQNKAIEEKIKFLLTESQLIGTKISELETELKQNGKIIKIMDDKLRGIEAAIGMLNAQVKEITGNTKSIKDSQKIIIEKLDKVYLAVQIIGGIVTAGMGAAGFYFYSNNRIKP